MPPELTILMPVYDESERIARALDDVFGTDWPFEVELIVVDDGSTDGTRDFLRSYQWPAWAHVYYHDSNKGKGGAVRTALGHATGRFSVIFDADLEYQAADLVPLVQPLREGLTNEWLV